MTAFLDFDGVVTKVYDILRLDSRTSNIDWYNGDRGYTESQKFPSGKVFVGAWDIQPLTMPAGEQAGLEVLVEIAYLEQGGTDVAERQMRLGVDAVAAVLVDTIRQVGHGGWDIGLPAAYPERVSGRPVRAPVMGLAQAVIALFIRIIPTGS